LVVKLSNSDNIKPIIKSAFEKYLRNIPKISIDDNDGVLLSLFVAVTERIETLVSKPKTGFWVPVAFQRYENDSKPNALVDPWGRLVTVYYKGIGNNIIIMGIAGGDEKLIEALKKPLVAR